jgi:2-succinyl-5-enolpyruvyl-6-hydroxy-3-cyclohexene-1-carboxylate synthase
MSASPRSEPGPPSAGFLVGEWARLLWATLVSAGVRDVWVSPGSRSTPFVWAAAHTPGLRVRAVVDERSAAFMALGHARVSGRPNALLCTSGTAAANYLPAIVEASLSHLPLIVITADRPLEVQQAGAAQTIDQVKLYGAHARSFFDLGLPDAAPSALVGLRRTLAQAVATSLGPVPGPVHLNARARKPLEPQPAQTEADRALSAQVAELLARPLVRHAPVARMANEAVLAAARTLHGAASGAIVVGPLPASGRSLAEPIGELSRRLGFPILGEAASQVRFALQDHELSLPLFDWLLSARGRAQPDPPEVLLCLGQTPTSSAFERWAAAAPRRLVLAEHGLPDAHGSAELVASGDLEQGLAALLLELRRLEPRLESSAFTQRLRAAHSLARRRINAALGAAAAELGEGLAVKCVVESLPDGAVLALGNSLPIRDVDAYVTHAAHLRVTSQRGANGIDGLLSGGIGSAIGSRSPTLVLLGDVSLLHDIGALASARLSEAPLVIAVVDNAGGRIFDQLPVQKLYGAEPEAAQLWRTPPGAELTHAAALFGLRYVAPADEDAIRRSTAEAMERPEPTLLHLRVGATSAADLRARILDELGPELEALGG